ncbi:MAG: hypothetical protein FGM27_09000 [Candidatus Omnitrophica bacterium]|nr:hypothetical protein [Candidatus Omnitrophota bacterium]
MPQDPLQALDSLRLPEELGSIQETYIPQGIKPQRFVAAIQDAHSIPDAQRNIQRIIDYFQSQYGVDSVAVEGSASELDP